MLNTADRSGNAGTLEDSNIMDAFEEVEDNNRENNVDENPDSLEPSNLPCLKLRRGRSRKQSIVNEVSFIIALQWTKRVEIAIF